MACSILLVTTTDDAAAVVDELAATSAADEGAEAEMVEGEVDVEVDVDVELAGVEDELGTSDVDDVLELLITTELLLEPP